MPRKRAESCVSSSDPMGGVSRRHSRHAEHAEGLNGGKERHRMLDRGMAPDKQLALPFAQRRGEAVELAARGKPVWRSWLRQESSNRQEGERSCREKMEEEAKAVLEWCGEGCKLCPNPQGCRLPAGVTGRAPFANLHMGHVYKGEPRVTSGQWHHLSSGDVRSLRSSIVTVSRPRPLWGVCDA